MTLSLTSMLIASSLLLILSVLATKVLDRLGVPSLLVFLAVGMLAGSEGLGGIYFDNALATQTLGSIALAYILFSGALETEFDHIRPILKPGLWLASLGVLLTCGLTGAFSVWALGFTPLEGLLLGAIVSSTDAAAVFAVLRSRGTHLKSGIQPLLELESGANDPMAVLLTVGILELMNGQVHSPWGLIPEFFREIALGGILGWAGGKAAVQVLNRLKLSFEGLYPVFTIAFVVLTYAATQALKGSGFLAVYVAGLVLARENFIHKKSLMHFHGGIAWLMQIAMFLTLGLLVYPSRLIPVAGHGFLISAFLILLARPIATYLSLFRSGFTVREKAMISWVGLRGSVPIILATYPLLAGIDKADLIFHLVFFTVLTSVLIQGTSIPWVSKLLRVQAPHRRKALTPIESMAIGDFKNDLVELEVPHSSPVIGKSILELQLPRHALIVLIQRNESIVIPRGGTHLEAEDTLLVLAERALLDQIRKLVKPKN